MGGGAGAQNPCNATCYSLSKKSMRFPQAQAVFCKSRLTLQKQVQSCHAVQVTAHGRSLLMQQVTAHAGHCSCRSLLMQVTALAASHCSCRSFQATGVSKLLHVCKAAPKLQAIAITMVQIGLQNCSRTASNSYQKWCSIGGLGGNKGVIGTDVIGVIERWS